MSLFPGHCPTVLLLAFLFTNSFILIILFLANSFSKVMPLCLRAYVIILIDTARLFFTTGVLINTPGRAAFPPALLSPLLSHWSPTASPALRRRTQQTQSPLSGGDCFGSHCLPPLFPHSPETPQHNAMEITPQKTVYSWNQQSQFFPILASHTVLPPQGPSRGPPCLQDLPLRSLPGPTFQVKDNLPFSLLMAFLSDPTQGTFLSTTTTKNNNEYGPWLPPSLLPFSPFFPFEWRSMFQRVILNTFQEFSSNCN